MEQDNDQKKGITTSPCLVARLMGLDSMPVSPCSTPPSSISRSKSTSYLQSTRPVFFTTDQRVKTSSVSFREVPTFLKQENEDFLVLTFNADDKESNSSRTKVDEKDHEKIKERRRSSRRRLSSELESLVQDGGWMKVNKKEIAVEMIRKDEEIFQSNCELGDEEVKTMNWIARNGWNSEQVEEIAVETGLEILSFLLLEVVKEFY
ncbi:hypothetical protein J5N97_014830 [Dioscorea zingiberensis]|uniref:DUF3741 domain-containing protein n=1 Tax=Dioscorea zingiberensis TaxID=325984 RepID=A0A9D5CT33_9LILI|nr:hypothetical protein J5N97_014830 [Dioscorea zingiberensis]